ncbi:MAG: acyltransferase [Candidatus Geothermincolia bacterium]
MEFLFDRSELRAQGENTVIHPLAKILSPQSVSLGAHSMIDDFVFIQGGKRTILGDFVHIASFVSITGGGELHVGDFAGISSGCRIFTGSDLFDGSGLTGPTIPSEYRAVERSFIRIGAHAVIGSNSVVLPGVTIGEGAIVGANSLVTRSVPDWTVVAGSPSRIIKQRPREVILDYARRLREQ